MAGEATIQAEDIAASLRDSVSGQPEAQQILPPLVPETTFLDELAKRWEALQEQLMNMISRSAPDLPEEKISNFVSWLAEIAPIVAEGIWWLLLAGIVAVIIYVLIRFFADRDPNLNLTPEPLFTSKDTTSDLNAEIGRAIEAGRIDLALRLRWRLFTLRMDYPKHHTPAEYAARKSSDTPFQVTSLYPRMFRGDPATRDDFNQFHAGLKTKEAGRGFD